VAERAAGVDLRAAGIYREAGRIYRAHPVALLLPGAALFLVFGVPSVLFGEATTTQGAEAFATALTAQSLGLVSSFLYYGYCEEIADQSRTGGVSVSRALRETRGVLFKLIVVSVIVDVLVVLGLALLIVPGILLSARWGLVAPIASFERRWPLGAMHRSATLVKGHFGLILVTVVVMLAGEQIASALGEALGAEVFGDHLVGAVLGDAAGDLLLGPFAGLLIAIVYFRLSGRGAGATTSEGQL
jgi:hypothetical protein